MKIIILLLITYSSILATDWVLVWSDEFDTGEKPDETKWSYATDGNTSDWWNEELQNYTTRDEDNAWIEDGTLIIEARNEKTTWEGDDVEKDYTSARLITKGKGDWTYGKFEIRAKLPTGQGTWPAIWMLGSTLDYGNWPACGEIDIMENLGHEPEKVYATIHCEAYNHSIGQTFGNTTTVSTTATEFHVYSLEWTPDTIKVGIDGENYFSFGNQDISYREWPFDKDHHLLLNVAMGGWAGEVDPENLPQRMTVDYVRVYQDTTIHIEDTPVVIEDEQVTNSTFDTDVSPWNLYEANGADGAVAATNGELDFSVSTLGDFSWDVQLNHTNIKIEEGVEYEFRFDAKADAVKEINAGIGKNYGTYSTYLIETVELSTTMETYSYIFTADTSDYVCKIFFNIAEDLSDVTLDNIYFTKVGTTGNIETTVVPNKVSLSVYPNPFNPVTTISFSTPLDGGKVTIYNILGEKITGFDTIKAGSNTFSFDGSKMASGIYFLKINQNSNVYTRKMILLK